MHEKSLKILEFDQIVRLLSGLSFSPPGRWRCERIEPVSDYVKVQRRLHETTAVRAMIEERGLPPMQGIADIRSHIRHSLTGAALEPKALLEVAAFLRAVDRLVGFLPDQEEESYHPFYALLRSLMPINDLERRISTAILGEQEIADRASRKLADIRQAISRAQTEIRRRLESLLQTKAEALQEQLITMRNGRYVLPVKAGSRGAVRGLVHDSSASGQTLFIEPEAVVEANNRITELELAERDEIERILKELSGFVAGQKDFLYENYNLVGKIDFALAKGRLSQQLEASAPQLNENGYINLIAARHPLIDPDQVVPIDLYIGDRFKTLVITGPNTGGKTVSLKTCGLLTLMALAGLHIPAAPGSTVSTFVNVMADIGDEQSIEQSLSTFSAHMKNIVSITDAARPGMLVLTDELGSGTDPSEGAALAIAVLDFLRAKGVTTVATTHYRELKVYALEEEGVENACCEFDTDTLAPTYRLLIGVPGVSNAFVISGKLGLNRSIVQAAKQQLDRSGLQFEAAIKQVEKERSTVMDLRQDLETAQSDLKRRQETLNRRERQLLQKEQKLAQEAREKARTELAGQLRATEDLLKELKKTARSSRAGGVDEQVLGDAATLRRMLRGEIEAIEGEIGRATLSRDRTVRPAAVIEPGQVYYSATLKATGMVEEGPDSKGRYLLRAGAVTMWVEGSDLAAVPVTTAGSGDTGAGGPAGGKSKSAGRPNRAARRAAAATGRRPSKAASFSPEINVIGRTADEATLAVDRFLDDAVLAGGRSLRIVHGKGSGILRAAVGDLLKKDSRVKSFRAGHFGEGDSGVTIVELK